MPDDAYAEDGLVQEAREEAEGSENAQTPSSEETQPREEITTDSDYSETATDDAQRDPVTFTSQPVPPYYYGDRWVHDGETYSCVNESDETFSESDWALIDDYVIPTATYSQATRTVEEYITDYSAESLTEYQQSGAVPYAVYDDGTEVQVTWADVHDPSTAGDEFVTEAEQVALANNQHFWQRSTNPDGAGAGAFVTDSEQTDFLTAAASGFPDLSNNKPWHNMLLNSTGMLFRRALNNLVSITRSAVAFYDGAGNAAANVLASFGATSAQIGKSSASHIVMDANGVRQYLATKLRSAITATGFDIYGTNGTTSIASFGSTTRIGATNQQHMQVESGGIALYDGTNTEFMRLAGSSDGTNSYGGITVKGAPNVESSIQTLVDGTIKLTSCSTYDDDYGAGVNIRAERLYGTNGSKSDFIEIQTFANDSIGRALRINEHTPTAYGTLAEFGNFTNWFIKRSDFDSDAYFNENIYVNGYISSYSDTEVKFAKSPAVYANVNLHGTTIDRDGAIPSSSNVYEDTRTFRIVDVDGDGLVTIRAMQSTSGTISAQIIAWNTDGDGATVYNIFGVGITKNGAQTYTVSSPTNFRNAIGATSGVFPRSAGGTGMSERTTGTVTRSGIGTDGTVVAYSNGVINTVTMYGCKLKTALTAGSSVELATLPTGYRPPTNMYAVVTSSATAGMGNGSVTILSDGRVIFHNAVAWSTNATIAFTVSWAK